MRFTAFLLTVFLAAGCAGTSISGYVRDAETGEPLPGVEVAAGNKATTTNEEGLFQITDLERRDRHVVHVTAEGYEPLRRTVGLMEDLDDDQRALKRDFALVPRDREVAQDIGQELPPGERLQIDVDLDRERLRSLHRYMEVHNLRDYDAALKDMIDRFAEEAETH